MARGSSFLELFTHTLWRSLALAALGVFVRSMDQSMTYFTFEDTLSLIGFGYPFLFLVGYKNTKPEWMKWVWASLGLILVGYWLLWALYPAAPTNFDWQTVGVSEAWNAQHNFTGFAAPWDKNFNFGNHFDRWFLNKFPREKPFQYNSGGYLTLSFIPTLGTMILWPDCRMVNPRVAPEVPHEEISNHRNIVNCVRACSALLAPLPSGETNLDAVLDNFQRRHLLPVLGRLRLGN
jgi:hypothetical protein